MTNSHPLPITTLVTRPASHFIPFRKFQGWIQDKMEGGGAKILPMKPQPLYITTLPLLLSKWIAEWYCWTGTSFLFSAKY